MIKSFRSRELEFEVTGDYALFSDPLTRTGGEKFSYGIPTYEALKGILQSVYYKPTLVWIIDEVRIMNEIRTQSKGILVPKYNGGKDLSFYTYLRDVRYQVRAHFEWNENHPELACDRNPGKHEAMAEKYIRRGGRRDIFLGSRECQGDVQPCVFGEGEGCYDGQEGPFTFGLMFHGMTYADEAVRPEDRGQMTRRFWNPVMEKGIIRFCRPEECTLTVPVKPMGIKKFGIPKDEEVLA